MANLTNLNNKFLVTTGGAVLINQTSTVSTHLLTVNGRIGGPGFSDSYLQFTGGNVLLKANDNVKLGYSQEVVVSQAGNLGIGGTPGQNLDVIKTGARLRLIDPVDGANLQLNIGLWDNSNYRFEGDSQRPMFLTSYQGNIYLGISGNTTMTIQSAKVGVGTTTPQKSLHIEGAAGASVAQVLVCGPSDTVGTTAGILLRAEGGEGDSGLRAKGAIFFEREAANGLGKLHLCNNNSNNNDSATLADAALTIRSSRTIGIGSAGFDSQMLTIAAGTLDGAIYATSTDDRCEASFRDGNSTANITYGAYGNDHVLRKDSAQYFIVNNVGDVYNYQSVNKANTFYGYAAGDYSAAGGSNTFMGYNCANNLSSGAGNVGIGRDVYIDTLTGSNNTAVGMSAMQQLTSGGNNVAVGKGAGKQLTSGSVNTFVGDSAGTLATTANSNTAVGFTALSTLTTGDNNTAIGRAAAAVLTTGTYVIAIGNWAADALTTNGYTIAIGYDALTTATAGDNVAIGYTAGQDLTTGTNNTFLGNYAGRNVTTSSYGTYLGRTAGQGVTSGGEPVFVGYDAGQQVTSGNHNTCIGTSAMTYGNGSHNTYVGWQCGFGSNGQDNSNNTAIGKQSMRNIQTGSNNGAMGRGSLYNLTTGSYNMGLGWDAYQAITTTSYNTGVGANTGVYQTGNYNTSTGYHSNYGVSGSSSGDYNTAMGYFAGAYNRGENNTFLGAIAGRYCSTGQRNTIVGSQAMDNQTMTGSDNTVMGFAAAQNITTGYENILIGKSAASGLTTANANIGIGLEVLDNCTSSTGNIAIGYSCMGGGGMSGTGRNIALGDACGYNVTSGSNNILIGWNAGRTGSQTPQSMGGVTTGSNQIHIGNESHSNALVQVSWTVNSDGRDKTDIKDLDLGLDFIDSLRPVTYRWDKRSQYEDKKPTGEHKETKLEVGLIAQEVIEQENKSGYNFEDETNLFSWESEDKNKVGLQYEKLVPALINAIKELKAEIEILKSK